MADNPPTTYSHESYEAPSSLVVIGIVLAVFFYFLKIKVHRGSRLQNGTELVVIRPSRINRNSQLRNLHFENEHEQWLNYVTVMSHQQRLVARNSLPIIQIDNQEHFEPVIVPPPLVIEDIQPVHDDLPPNYEVPPSYEECTTKKDRKAEL